MDNKSQMFTLHNHFLTKKDNLHYKSASLIKLSKASKKKKKLDAILKNQNKER